MYVRACVRACACLIAFLVRVIKRTFERDGNFTHTERERERGLDGKIFFVFFISFLSCLVLSCLLASKTSLSKARRKRRIIIENKAARGRSVHERKTIPSS